MEPSEKNIDESKYHDSPTAARSPDAKDEPALDTLGESALSVAATDPFRVLVVDDSQTVRKSVKRMLEAAGYVVIVANNGEEALSALENNPVGYFKIVLMDIYMPKIDGVRTANIIRDIEAQRNNGHHQIIVGLSDETRNLTADLMDCCLMKPFDLESFESVVHLFRLI